jgi:hypothetical protein
MKHLVRVGGALLLLPAIGGCGTTEVVVGEAPGIARVVAGVLGQGHLETLLETAVAGPAAETPLGSPGGIVGREDGSFYVADRFRHRVAAVSADGQLTWPLGRGVCGSPGLGNGDPLKLCLDEAYGLAAAGGGVLYIADHGAHRVYRYDSAAAAVTVLLGTGAIGVAAEGDVAATAPTTRPTALAVGPDGAVYVAETGNNRIIKVGADGLVAVVAGTGDGGDAGDDGPARDAVLTAPAGLAWSGDTLFVSDAGNHRIRLIVNDTIHAFAGLGAPGFAGDRGRAAAALFDDPGALATVGGLLFVADRRNNRVRIIRLGPDSIDTFVGTGAATAGPDLLEAGRTAIMGPAGLAAAGRAVFVSDSGGYVVRRIIR